MLRFELAPCEVDLCIGQLALLMQHAIRASGVACHPAQTATLPTDRARIAAVAARRLAQLTTCLECWTAADVSNAERFGRLRSRPGFGAAGRHSSRQRESRA